MCSVHDTCKDIHATDNDIHTNCILSISLNVNKTAGHPPWSASKHTDTVMYGHVKVGKVTLVAKQLHTKTK